jgi:hypothetical protein
MQQESSVADPDPDPDPDPVWSGPFRSDPDLDVCNWIRILILALINGPRSNFLVCVKAINTSIKKLTESVGQDPDPEPDPDPDVFKSRILIRIRSKIVRITQPRTIIHPSTTWLIKWSTCHYFTISEKGTRYEYSNRYGDKQINRWRLYFVYNKFDENCSLFIANSIKDNNKGAPLTVGTRVVRAYIYIIDFHLSEAQSGMRDDQCPVPASYLLIARTHTTHNTHTHTHTPSPSCNTHTHTHTNIAKPIGEHVTVNPLTS